jgi:hypothetical protein
MSILSVVALSLGYGAFLLWYGGSGELLTEAEVDAYLRILEGPIGQSAGLDAADLERIREFGKTDDGRPFLMLNLIRLRERPAYPSGEDPGGTVADADARYTRALAPLLLARGGHPVALLTPFAVFLDTGPSPAQWDTVALMRHRSRRDFLDMITSSEYARAEVHKWASVADTLVIGSEGILVPDPRALLFLAFAAVAAAVAAAERWGTRRRHSARRGA